jgi:uncharacterized protein (TIGR02996 family)
MSEDEAFIRAIREAPGDETARLVYADWLDDRSDPRAEYLRAEAAWVALQPADEQYRPLYRRLSRLAAALDPAWFAAIGRVGQLVRRAWEPVADAFAPEEPSPAPAIDLPRAWAESARRLRELLASSFGAAEVERRFCPPADFVAFLCLVGAAGDGWDYLRGSEAVVAANTSNVRVYEPGQTAPEHWTDEEVAERPANPEIWLEFGGWSDKHWYFVCCDLGSPLFGIVAEGEDYHPWMSGSESLDFRGRNFLHFLGGYLPLYRERDTWDTWPRVPHADWATF